MADRSNRWYGDTLRHAAVWSSAKPTPHSTILRSLTNVHQLRLHLHIVKLDVFTFRHKVTPKYHPTRLSSPLFTSPHLIGILRFQYNELRRSSVRHSQAAFYITSLCKSIHSRHHFNTILRRPPTALIVGKYSLLLTLNLSTRLLRASLWREQSHENHMTHSQTTSSA